MLLFLGLVLLNGLMYLQQPSMTFSPYATHEQTPTEWGLVYEDVYLHTEDGVRLHAWYIPHQQVVTPTSSVNESQHEIKQTLLFFHGNAGNISHRGSSIEIFHRLGLNVFIIDYRSFGKSQGSTSEQGIYNDAQAAWRYLTDERNLESKDIIVFGRSLGGVVAAQLAAQVQPSALIIESSFSSARDVANAIFPLLSPLIFLRYDFNTLTNVKQVKSPVLVLHSPNDEVIPFHLGEKIFKAANEPKYFVKMRGGHNNSLFMSQPEYEQALGKFVRTGQKN